jgi:hypothetical protein
MGHFLYQGGWMNTKISLTAHCFDSALGWLQDAWAVWMCIDG